MPNKTFRKDSAGALNSLRDIISKLQEQAAEGQIDGALLSQAGAVMDVAMDTAPDPDAEMAAQASSTGETSVSSPSTPVPSVPSSSSLEDLPEMTKEDEEASIPTTEPEEESTTEDDMSIPSSVSKAAQPVSGRPPIKQYNTPNLIFDHLDEMRARVPDFIKAVEMGDMGLAHKVAGSSSVAFDTMFNLAQHAILDEGGWTTDNLSKINGMAVSDPNALAKGITASSVPGIYLIRLAKLMLPLYAGLVNRLPTQSPTAMGGTQATWKAQLGHGTLASPFRVAEAAVGVNPPTSFLTFNAPFNDESVNDTVTLKALAASKGYSDPLQISVIKSMSALLRGQEKIILGSNYAAIAAPTSVTASGSTTGGSLAAGSYIACVTALTYEGWDQASVGGSGAVGESTATAATVVVTTGSTSQIALTWPAVAGAVAYNVYLTDTGGAGSAAKYIKTVLINKAAVTAVATATTTPPAADTTVNTYGIEGLIPWCMKSTVYSNSIPSKIAITDNAGAGMTAGNGGITQFDVILASMWTNWQISPTLMVMSPNMNSTLVGKLQSLGSGNFYRIEVGGERGQVQGGMMVTGYVNKFAPTAGGIKYIDIIPHPYMPDGTVLFMCETIPYPMGNESRGFVRDVLVPYTYFPLPSQVSGTNQILYNYALTTSEVVECFNPSPQAALVGVDYSL